MNNTIKFVLDDNIAEIDFSKLKDLKPTTTVLNYLRSLGNHKGVKEGCAEGDCGACTIVIAEPGQNGKLNYKSVDSCLLFLPMIHGKQLITIENLSQRKNGNTVLHPVQEMMVNSFGTQCGYCTPGFIMSLFALYKNHSKPTREITEDSLSGNLCRCTGYQSILEAAAACKKNSRDHFSEKTETTLGLLNEINYDKTAIMIETDKQIYYRPFRLDDALMLRKYYSNAVLINGATDIALKQTKKNELLAEIIDLSGVEELKIYDEEENGFYFGAGMSLENLKAICEKEFPALYDILKLFGSLQIRNLATIGGNVGSASPIGDTLPVLFAYKAKVIVQSSKNKREIDIEDFIKGYRKTDLKSDELITSVFIPKPEKNVYVKSYKVSKRKDLDISTVSLACRLILEKDNIKEILLAYGGMAETTKRAKKTEDYLLGKEWSRKTIEEAMKIVYDEFKPISDARSSEEFRKIISKNLLMKMFIEILK